jgi:hypothetical protein
MDLILTFDYELFGDGKGDVFIHMIEPTDKILQICAEYDIKATIFFEAIEYLKLKEEWGKGNKMGYTINPIEAIEKQIQKAALNQHDIQLHIHPQWVNANWIKNNWEVDFKNWRLGDFNSVNDYSIRDLIRDGQIALENIINQVIPKYKCIGLRAGGYNIMPSNEVVKAMKELGLKFDSSIFPGGYENTSLSKFDYRNISLHKDNWWADCNDIRCEKEKEREIFEFPIFALAIPRWRKLISVSKITSRIMQHKTTTSSLTKEKIKKEDLLGKIKFLIQKESYTWDVCMFSKTLHQKYFRFIENNLLKTRNTFVVIGHPKNLQNENKFREFVKVAHSRKHKYSFITMRYYYERKICNKHVN